MSGWLGRSVPRKEDRRLLAGEGRFLADLAGPGTLHVAFLRSTQARAELARVEAGPARALPGVHMVLTGDDLTGRLPLLHEPHPDFVAATRFAMADPHLPCLASGAVGYVGQPVAAVVADSRHLAEDALELIDVDYAPLDPVVDADRALAATVPLVHPHLTSNEAARIEVRFGDVEAARRAAAAVVTETFRMGRHGGAPLECRGALARLDPITERLELVTSSQIPHQVRAGVCTALGLTEDRVRVSVPDVGGGFGTKANVYAEEVVVAELARRLHREVLWVEDRIEHLTGAAQARDQVHHTRLAVAADGRILSWESDFVIDVGFGSLWTAGIIANTAVHLLGPYRVDDVRITGRAAFTNKALVAQYRGAGRPEACFALERSLDLAARRLGMTGAALRRRNLLTADDMPYPRPIPYRDGVPVAYDGGDHLACQQAAEKMLDTGHLSDLAAAHPGLVLGYGLVNYLEATGRGPWESGRAELTGTGRLLVGAGSASAGQSHETTLAQVAAEVLQVPPQEITVRTGDTDAIAHGIGTFASRSAVLAGSAVYLAARELVDRAEELAAELLGAAEARLDGGKFTAAGTDRTVGWPELAAALAPGGLLEHRQPLACVHRFRPGTVTWTMGTHVAIVGVDRETGLCSVLRYAVAHEGGTEINPMVVAGQVAGGVAQGIGGALLEEFRYTAEGQPQSTTLSDYLLPGTCEVPAVEIRHLPVQTTANPIGVRGVGESGTIAVYAAVAAAVDDAVDRALDRPTPSLTVTATPVRPEDVLAAMSEGRA
ncbi:xanthine dehydrogenase family protein molybdopterin-binding subunit [Nonomuraea sp. NPDC050451]|uniref:xanthine dehydrogenase family protein molybdopterin-binding subunit n=1 Tax=Nonomuraea sp. NPDC050451 TaxID=3364364 RepID=UPI003798D34A